MYLKVYRKDGHPATVQEVQNALPQNAQGLTVDEDLGYPCVEFPRGQGTREIEQVRSHLQANGFETE